mmetsp:Transcript_1391/g.2492  ORF Transcript_1391/g.2492 Transcript_1391/m.2492 type:complete len:295 (-) Transcript_1391:1354-2238(-)
MNPMARWLPCHMNLMPQEPTSGTMAYSHNLRPLHQRWALRQLCACGHFLCGIQAEETLDLASDCEVEQDGTRRRPLERRLESLRQTTERLAEDPLAKGQERDTKRGQHVSKSDHRLGCFEGNAFAGLQNLGRSRRPFIGQRPLHSEGCSNTTDQYSGPPNKHKLLWERSNLAHRSVFREFIGAVASRQRRGGIEQPDCKSCTRHVCGTGQHLDTNFIHQLCKQGVVLVGEFLWPVGESSDDASQIQLQAPRNLLRLSPINQCHVTVFLNHNISRMRISMKEASFEYHSSKRGGQ